MVVALSRGQLGEAESNGFHYGSGSTSGTELFVWAQPQPHGPGAIISFIIFMMETAAQ